jgi:pentatricopeptide repeat protein
VKVWEEESHSRAGGNFDFAGECERMVGNLRVNRYTKSSNITKIFDHVTNAEQLDLAEKALISFRHSLSQPTPALPLVVVRGCLRAGAPQRALRLVRNKVTYGVFPSRRVFHILTDAFIREGDGAGALEVYHQMLKDEVTPDEMTFHLASRAYGLLVCAGCSIRHFSLCPGLTRSC